MSGRKGDRASASGQAMASRPSEPMFRLSELGGGARISMMVVLNQKRVRQTKAGAPYLVANLSDSTGEMLGVLFDYRPDDDALDLGSVVEIDGVVEVFNGARRIKLHRMVTVPGADPSELVRASARPIAEMSAQYGEFVKSIGDSAARETVKRVLRSDNLYQQFKYSPLTDEGYGAWNGGALEHTLRVVRLVISACESQPEVDRDLVLAAALLHQVGAPDAIEAGTRPTLTARGRTIPRATLSMIRLQAGLGEPVHRTPFHNRLEQLVASSSGTLRTDGSHEVPAASIEETVLRGSIDLAYSVGRRAAAGDKSGQIVELRRVG